MSDWIEQLERLTRLHKDGALTDEEFALQKARLLEGQAAAVGRETAAAEPAPAAMASAPGEGSNYEESVRPRWPLFAGIGAVVVAVVAGAAWFGSGIVPDSGLTQPGPAATATVAGADVATDAATEAPVPVALDGTLAFASPSLCQAGDTLERVYKKLEAGMDLGSGRGLTVALDAYDTPLPITAKNGKDKDGAETASAELRFPATTTWHGLKLSRITSSRYYPPETDGSDTRTVNFLEPPEKVKRTLARLGFGVPVTPDYAPIDSGEGCGGAMQIEKRDGGSALVCTWGC
ncbi:MULTISPECIES: SHOCT domain-containing protein [unclassified Novosphingobium]|uniref:SHOCT domain-containing protein n=1 Tax=unclassified Novosphingobium TaxID=2644732 RepID=UPI0025CC6B07|nr:MULTISPECIES: SHOCT domain-containing protein [unclassified Novosphingobium]HQV05033.1 SHOCT domain-containing protein [Novosphingobium sp.]